MRPLSRLPVALVLLALLSLPSPSFAAEITLVNLDGPGEGFNDSTPVAPVGDNPGTTLGDQRRIAFQFALDLWGSLLASDVEILVQASFDPLFCNAFQAILATAGATQAFADFPGAEIPATLYHSALANKLAGFDLAPGPTGTDADDVAVTINVRLDDPDCLGERRWYYGLDTDNGEDVHFAVVMLHELAHGLGFTNFTDEETGELQRGLPGIYSAYTLDTETGKTWAEMTDAERAASAVNSRDVVWSGLHVTAAVPDFLEPGTPLLTVHMPPAIAGDLAIGTAAFGPALEAPGITGDVVLAEDGDGVSTDACTPLVNGGEIAGRIALVDRGGCAFTTKAVNAQDAGAIAVVLANNQPGSPPPNMGGTDPSITIPMVSITQSDGIAIKDELAAGSTVNVTIGLKLDILAGANRQGQALLHTPVPVNQLASIVHWDPVARPNLLMEPNIAFDLPIGVDMTLDHFADLGWFSDADGVPDGRDACLGSDPRRTVVIDGCDSGADNDLFPDGCKISDLVDDCAAGAAEHGEFVSCVAKLTNRLRDEGALDDGEKGAIQSCAGQADIP